MRPGQYVVLVVEDALSEAILRRLLDHSTRDFVVHTVIVAKGYGRIKSRMCTFKTACKAVPHIVLTDLDRANCAPDLLREWDANSLPEELLFRVAVREVEAWLLGDQDGLARFLGVPVQKIPSRPEDENDPKQTLINIARRSRRKGVAAGIPPAIGSRTSIGPLYNASLGRFVREHWNVTRAITNVSSLAKAVVRIDEFLR